MSLDQDLRRSGARLASGRAAPASADPLRARIRRGRTIGVVTVAVVLVAVTVTLGRNGRDESSLYVDQPGPATSAGTGPPPGRLPGGTAVERPTPSLQAGHGRSTVTAADGTDLGDLPTTTVGGPLGRARRELLTDPAVEAALERAGVAGPEGERLSVLATAGLRIETSLDPAAQRAAERAVAATTTDSPEAAGFLVSVDPGTGRIEAIAGSLDGTGRQPGSALQPLLMAAALDAGVGPDERISDPTTVALPGLDGSSAGVVGGGTGGETTPTEALATGAATPWLQLLADGRVRPDEVAALADRLGIGRAVDARLRASLLGALEVEPVDLLGAYTPFAGDGHQRRLHLVQRILGPDGTVVFEAAPTDDRVVDAQVAGAVRRAMQRAVCCGTAQEADLGDGTPIFGKTGTTESGADRWFVGGAPDVLALAWVGGRGPVGGVAPPSSRPAIDLWRTFMAATAPHPGTFPG